MRRAHKDVVKKLVQAAAVLGWLVSTGAWATTLEPLTVDEMIQKSTAIVRGTVTSMGAQQRGSIIYQQVQIKVLERFKGSGGGVVDVLVPGGALNGVRQTFSGTPQLLPGVEYVFFLWTGPRGSTQIVGLAQGVLNLKLDAKGDAQVQRAAITEGVGASIDAIAMSLESLRIRIQRVAGARE